MFNLSYPQLPILMDIRENLYSAKAALGSKDAPRPLGVLEEPVFMCFG